MKTIALTIVVAFVLMVSPAESAPVTIQNASFESPSGSAPNGLFDSSSGNIGSWNYQRTGLLAQTLTDVSFQSSALATSGSNVATFDFLASALGGVSLSQTLGVSLLPNTLYTLTFDADQYSAVNLLTSASVSLLSGGLAVATLSDSTFLSLLDGTNGLSQVMLQYQTGTDVPVGNVGILFTVGGVAQVLGAGLVIDNLQLDATTFSSSPAPSGLIGCHINYVPTSGPAIIVPEPSAALMVMGSALCLLRRTRQGVCPVKMPSVSGKL